MAIKAFIQRLFSKPVKENKPVKEKVPFTASASMGLEEPPRYDLMAQLSSYHSWVYAAVTKIAQAVAECDLHLYRKGKEIEEVKQHEVIDLLHRVNNSMTFYDLVELYETYMLLTGECFWWLVRNDQGEIIEIYPWLRPDRMSVVPSKEKFVEGYVYNVPGTGEKIPFVAEDILHFKKIDPLNPYRGMSPVKAAEYAVATDLEASKYNWRFFKNDARPSGVLKYEGTLTEEQFERLKSRWETEHRGENQHKVAILTGGMDYRPISISQRDMEFLSQRKFSRDEIFSIFKIPRLITEETNRASAEAALYGFMRDTVIPEMRKFVNYLNEFLLPNYGDEELFFDFTNSVPRDLASDLAFYKAGIEAGFLSPNEIRAMENLPAVEGGNYLYVPLNLQPIGQVEELKSKSYKMAPRRRTLKDKISKEIKVLINKKKTKLAKEDWEIKMEALWRQKIAKTNQEERLFVKILKGEFERQKKEIVGTIKKKAFGFAFDVAKEEIIFRQKFRNFITEIVTDYGKREAARLKTDFVLNQNVIRWISENGLRFCKTVNAATKDEIKKELQKSIEEGEGISEAKKRIEKYFDEAEKFRAQTIARTEIARASNRGEYEAAVQSGVVKQKRWFTALDERVCETCSHLHGKTIPLDEAFIGLGETFYNTTAEFEDVVAGTAHPACRCVVQYLTSSKAEIEQDKKIKKALSDLAKAKEQYELNIKEMEKIRNKINNLIE